VASTDGTPSIAWSARLVVMTHMPAALLFHFTERACVMWKNPPTLWRWRMRNPPRCIA
jgi:hypothetical protein